MLITRSKINIKQKKKIYHLNAKYYKSVGFDISQIQIYYFPDENLYNAIIKKKG